ncbi:MAG TPA: NAD(P)(+) transhydrogenase (Re/Si-specific) subunit alpha, partial [Terriglobales bacterium]|nr:NAD(P)(+) transhydrogenase (Re/Si-specific) subunit alpha [Terriglobales bacterium]
MNIGIPRESYPGERRVAMTPAVVPSLTKAGFNVLVETLAGAHAGHSDDEFIQKGAQILSSRRELFASSQVILQVLALSANPPAALADLELMSPGQVLIGFLRPLGSAENILQLARAQITGFAIELLPRITRAQPMD